MATAGGHPGYLRVRKGHEHARVTFIELFFAGVNTLVLVVVAIWETRSLRPRKA